MKVWLVWQGEYSDADVSSIYSSLELAQAACAANPNLYIADEDGHEVDEDADKARAGRGRWMVKFDVLGNVLPHYPSCVGFAEGEPTFEERDGRATHLYLTEWHVQPSSLLITLDAKDKDHALKHACDLRRTYLSLPVMD